jgi:predicted nucleic acid-binding protein
VRFADTGWWVAWALPGDARHNDALDMLSILGQSEQILTTNLVAGETWTFLRRKDSHRTALAFLDRLDTLATAGRLVVHRVTEDQEAAAWDWLRRHDERVYSYVDATSFRVMRDRRLREALAFDQDFAAAGFVEVRAEPRR